MPTTPVLVLYIPPGAATVSTVYSDCRSHIIPHAPFRPDPAVGIVVIRLWIPSLKLSPDALDSLVTCLVPVKTIYDCLARASDPYNGSRLAGWRDWAIYKTVSLNLMDVLVNPFHAPKPFGSRLPTLIREKDSRLFGHIVVFDLNPTLVQARQRGLHWGGDHGWATMSEEAVSRFKCSAPMGANAPYVAVSGPRTFLLYKRGIMEFDGLVFPVSALRGSRLHRITVD